MTDRTDAQKQQLEEAREKAREVNKGNNYSSKQNRMWGNIVRKLAVQEDYKRLHEVANALYEKAAEGDISAIKELGDRLDGRVKQKVSGDSDSPVIVKVITGIDDD